MVTVMEEWKDIEGFEGVYKISNSGNVYSSYVNKTLKPVIRGKGYLGISLYIGRVNGKKKYKQTYIHRLVAEHFIDNPNNLPEVNHKNGNKLDCSVDNLEWITSLQNKRHAIESGLVNYKKKVLRSDGTIFDSITEAASLVNGDVSNLSKACRGILETAYGYSWELV